MQLEDGVMGRQTEQQTDDWKRSWLKYLVVLMLVLGLVFRFINLDRKVYWVDEAYTSLRISGYTETELIQEAFTGKVIAVADLQRYQQPSADRGWDDAWAAFRGNAEHAPLYFVLARIWVQVFGASIASIRFLSALISLFAFPALYWLCRELFAAPPVAAPAVGGVALAFLAVSPLHVLYAQEARQYSLLTVMTLAASAALLRSLRTRQRSSWALYALSVALGLYSHMLFGLVAIAHALYIAILEKFRPTKTFLAGLVSLAAGGLAFLPWLAIALMNLERIQKTTASLTLRYSFDYVFDRWFRNLALVFADQDLGSGNLILVLLAIAALVVLVRTTPLRVWLLVVLLVGVTFLPLALPDLIWGGQRSLRVRYLIPAYLGLQIAIAYLLTRLITQSQGWRLKLGRISLLTLLFAGVLGCCISSQAEVWWSKSLAKTSYFPRVAEMINAADRPLVISDAVPIDILAFSHELKPEVSFQLTTDPRRLRPARRFDTIFLLNPSNPLRNRLTRRWGYRATRAFTDGTGTRLWRLESNPQGAGAQAAQP